MPMRCPMVLFAALSIASAQTPARPAAAGPDPAKIASLLETGHCPEALPLSKRAYTRADADLKRRMGTGAVHCAMALNDASAAADFIGMLNRDFPNDPEI